MSASPGLVERALAEQRPLDEVLDLADEVIETGDPAELEWLARLLDEAAELDRGRPGLAIAAVRARAALPKAPLAKVAPEPLRYAGWWLRAGAHCLDWLVILIAAAFVPVDAGDTGTTLAVSFLFVVAYFAVLHGLNEGRTPGKLAAGIAVRSPDGGRIGPGRALARATAQGLLWLTVIGGLIDSLAPIGDRRNRALHDMVARTVVVRVR